MPKSYNQKMKLLLLIKAFSERTDEEHVLTMQDIKNELNSNGITAERKSIYDDIETLRLFGYDIINRREQPAGYYLASREFELPELKLLVDAVQASKFITYKKSQILIGKLERLASKYEAQQLQRQVFVANRIKAMNESIYYNVDKIHSAISSNEKIKFQYFEWTVTKETKLKKDGEQYKISPWALTWDDENYYLIGYDSEAQKVKHYRVDKMLNIILTGEKRDGQEQLSKLDIASYSKKTFGMFGGDETNVSILFENRLVGVVIDRFGKDVFIRKEGNDNFVANLNVVLSSQFYGWLCGLGTGAKVISPVNVVSDYKKILSEISKQY